MKNINAYIAGILMCVFGLIPPIKFVVQQPSEYFQWWLAIAGFLGVYTLFIKTDLIVQVIAVGGLIHSFYSKVPYLSQEAYVSIVACCYFYILCRTIQDHAIVVKFLISLMLLHGVFFFMQFIGHDTYFNFSRQVCFGVVGQHMQSASFSVILAAVLFGVSPFVLAFPLFASWFCHSAGAFLCVILSGLPYLPTFGNRKFAIKFFIFLFAWFMAWLILSHKMMENLSMHSGRLAAWVNTLRIWSVHPFTGWGFGTYKGVFYALSGMTARPYVTAHNAPIQILFEGGLIWFVIIYGYVGYLFVNIISLLRRKIMEPQARACLAGMTMMAVNMMFHFPDRQIQCVLLIVYFLAFIKGVVENGSRQTCHSKQSVS